jgi:DNA repair exonuclease SbcCD ATPase subunit
MKKVNFNKISIQNFLSIGEEVVAVEFSQGLHIITGNNKDKPDRQNAVGKSTIADALYFAIFGETLREIKKDLISNNITGGKTHVELDFSVSSPKGDNNFKVIRTLSPTKLHVYKDGVENTRDSISNTTKYLCDVLSASTSIFQNCVIMTVNNAVPFMAKTRIDKRKFIEDIFGMEVFSEMLSTLRQEYNEKKRDYEINISRLEEIKLSLNNHNNQKQKIIDRRNEKHELYISRQNNNTKEILDLQSQIADGDNLPNIDDIVKTITKLEDKLSKTDSNINKLIGDAANKKTMLAAAKETYTKIGTSEDKCPVCLRTIHDHDKENISKEKDTQKQNILILAKEIEAVSSNIKEADLLRQRVRKAITDKSALINETNLKKQNIDNINDRLTQLNKWQEELNHDIQFISNGVTEYDDLISDLMLRVNELDSIVQNSSQELAKLDVVKFIISEEGVKSYIVNKLLELLNNRLFFYLKKLDSNSICQFDEYFEESIVNDRNKICSYFNFSGAERKAIDLACLFAFSDIRRLQGNVQYNIAIYDELFDSSFDEKGIELITNILQERVQTLDECSIVISHRKESLKAVTGDVIFLEKENGITRRVDFSDY